MSIGVECPECRASYRVKDQYAGKTFQCKRCAASITVQSQLQEEPQETSSRQVEETDQEALNNDFASEEFAAALPPRVKSSTRKKSKKADQKRLTLDSTASSLCQPMKVALISIGLLFALSTLDLIIGLTYEDFDVPRRVLMSFKQGLTAGFMVRSLAQLAAVVAIVRRFDFMRSQIIAMTSFGLFHAVWQFWEYSILPNANMSGYVVIGGMVILRIVIIACFLSQEAEDHFTVGTSAESVSDSRPAPIQVALGALALLMVFSVHPIFMRAREVNDMLTGYVRMDESEKEPGVTYHRGRGDLVPEIAILSAMILIVFPFRVMVFRGLMKGSRRFRQFAIYAAVPSIVMGGGVELMDFGDIMKRPAGLGFAVSILVLKGTILWVLRKPESREYCLN